MSAAISRFLRGLRIRALVFAATFLGSVFLTGLYPALRDEISWHAQHELCRAAATGATRKMKLLLFLGANADGWNGTYRPILFAAKHGQSDAAELLLSEGVNVNSIGVWRQTPLMEAVWGGQTETARFLLARGAKVCPEHSGSALWQATESNQPEMVALLMKHGASDCYDAKSALSFAVVNAQSKVVKELLAGGVDPAEVLPLTKLVSINGDKQTIKLLRAFKAKQKND